MFNTTMTIRGRLVKDPELRFTNGGMAMCMVSVVDQPQRYDKESRKWVDQAPIFWDMTLWRDEAENVAESAEKGTDVLVVGRPIMDVYVDKEGATQKRMKFQCEAFAVRVDKFQSVRVNRAQRSSGGSRQAPEVQPADPWSIARQGSAEEPPF